MKRTRIGTILIIAFTAVINLLYISVHYEVLKSRDKNQKGLQSIVDYKRKKLDEEWETCNEIMEGMGGSEKEPLRKRHKKKSILSRTLYFGKQHFRIWRDRILKRI